MPTGALNRKSTFHENFTPLPFFAQEPPNEGNRNSSCNKGTENIYFDQNPKLMPFGGVWSLQDTFYGSSPNL